MNNLRILFTIYHYNEDGFAFAVVRQFIKATIDQEIPEELAPKGVYVRPDQPTVACDICIYGARDLDSARALIPPGYVLRPRAQEDDPMIQECWIEEGLGLLIEMFWI